MNTTKIIKPYQRVLTYLLSTMLVWQPVWPAFAAAIEMDGQPNNGQVTTAGNGVPVVNIATPNQSGVSHNTYQQFNVGPDGAVLNNNTERLLQTQQAGIIQNNPNLRNGAANAIINEVTSPNRSELKGYIEVGGKPANVIVTNPYGITCDGCGFINTPQATLSTGTVKRAGC
ncbi:filamentous hemagglutinin N-terminal domain-containing protein [Jinshanibacter sp. LJY008]|uniref:Filamentous hemagglutinin N-terminal domain-containing protein n=1 Tax=Limnobaculum eriocheiris TaxID=2897391 RepID=A0A9X1SPU4_9GAMM|nr:filamentous hemagglutinin N-terminal domain-containing protein [Limnobaculum eriocheiris]MCD1126442.1 filamentous hemagglutinin N-terminal domain-containing protein [Limnobaculum eriocheiris]